MTGDTDVITRLFQRFGPGRSVRIKQKHDEAVVDAIARLYPAGFDAEIPDGAGGTRVIAIVSMR